MCAFASGGICTAGHHRKLSRTIDGTRAASKAGITWPGDKHILHRQWIRLSEEEPKVSCKLADKMLHHSSEDASVRFEKAIVEVSQLQTNVWRNGHVNDGIPLI